MDSKRKRSGEASVVHHWEPRPTSGLPQSLAMGGASQCHGNELGIKPSQMVDENAVKKELIDMIILHKCPLSIVNCVGFQKYSCSLNPHFRMISQDQVKSEIYKTFLEERTKWQGVLRENVGRVAISMDMWTSKLEKRKFVAATAHFIDDSWTLKNFLFAFHELPSGYTEKSHMETYLKCFYKVLERKLSTLTFDDRFDENFLKETYSTRFDCEKLILGGKFLRMRCFTFTLKALVGEALITLGDATMKIQDSVGNWTITSTRKAKFMSLARELDVPYEKLVASCDNEWDSIYLMLERALLFRDVFKDEKLSDSGYTCIPSEEDWNLTKEICEILKVFYKVASFFSRKRYHTANEYFQKVCDMKLSLSEWANSEVKVVKDVVLKMMEKFDEFWTEVNTILAITAILDPRYKMYIVEYYFTKIYKDVAQAEIERVNETCYELFEEYRARARATLAKESKQIIPNLSHLQGTNGNDKQDPMSGFDSFVTERKKESVTTELDYYLDEEVLPRNDDFNILSWWQANGLKYPTLQKMAKDVLAIPVSKVASNAAFSTVGNVLGENFNKLGPDTIEALMCKRNWLTADLAGASLLEDEDDEDTD